MADTKIKADEAPKETTEPPKDAKDGGGLEASSKKSDALDFRSMAKQMSIKRGSVAPPGGLSDASGAPRLPGASNLKKSTKNGPQSKPSKAQHREGGVVVETKMEVEGKANITVKISNNNDSPGETLPPSRAPKQPDADQNPVDDEELPEPEGDNFRPGAPPATRKNSVVVKQEPMIFKLDSKSAENVAKK